MEQRLGFELVGFSKCSGYLVSMPLAGSGNPKSVVVNGAGAPGEHHFWLMYPSTMHLMSRSPKDSVCVCARLVQG